jgi:hypothetical protein
MHQIEIVRLCAIWDSADPEKENIPTVVELIDDEKIIELLAAETRSHWTDFGGHLVNPSDDPELAALEQKAIGFGDEPSGQASCTLPHNNASRETRARPTNEVRG